MTRRIALGLQADGSYGMRCSVAGYDVYANPIDDTQLTFDSAWNTVLPIYQSGAQLNLANGSTTTISFSSIGYIPLSFFMIRPNGQTGWNSPPLTYYSGTNIIMSIDTYIDHIKVVNKLGFAIDIAYLVMSAFTQ